MYHFCTITTADHLYKTLSLYDSIKTVCPDSHLHILCVDSLSSKPVHNDLHFYNLQDVSNITVASVIKSKYGLSRDKLRWSMKPIFLIYLLKKNIEQIIYTDNDIYFYNDCRFLFNLLNEYNFLLTPHHYPHDATKDQNWLEANFKVGLYNAGFIGVNHSAIPSLHWWSECCAYRCEKNALRGTFDDQKYLDLIPVVNEKAYIVRHKGCNVAEWNRSVIKRAETEGQVWLDGMYPLIFIHFNNTTIRAILQNEEPLLKTSFDIYLANLKKYKPELKITQLYKQDSLLSQFKYRVWKVATKLGF